MASGPAERNPAYFKDDCGRTCIDRRLYITDIIPNSSMLAIAIRTYHRDNSLEIRYLFGFVLSPQTANELWGTLNVDAPSVILGQILLGGAHHFFRSYNISSLCLKGKECNHPEEDDLEWKTVLNWSRSMDEKLTYDERISFGFSSESMIHHCFMKGYGLCKFSTHYYDSLFGNCFTFNADWGLASERVGSFLYESTFPDLSLKEKELKIIIAFNEEDYLLVPMVHIFFHPPDIAPNSRFETFEIHAGSVQSFVISQTTSVKLPPPYTTNCMDYNAIGSSSFRKGILSQFLCQTECEANESLHHCGCIFHFTRDGEYRILSDTYPYTFERQRVENIEVCYDTMKNCFDNETTDVIGFCKSICKIPCREVSYHVTTESKLQSHDIQEELTSWLSKNPDYKNEFALIKVRFTSKEYEMFYHVPMVQVKQLSSGCTASLGIVVTILLLDLPKKFLFLVGLIKERAKRKIFDQSSDPTCKETKTDDETIETISNKVQSEQNPVEHKHEL
ncbi:epithelial sodium channel subunit gamma-like [Tachypleus tridentatus]|uniref:epithelial sodium channel subunit gamma-like n=1 Tax=Tachypleus tridentatus TaxID=6853 RepID=UPI003FCF26FA